MHKHEGSIYFNKGNAFYNKEKQTTKDTIFFSIRNVFFQKLYLVQVKFVAVKKKANN